jgi:hypothetical protein
MHHDAITGTHSLSTKRDYEVTIEQTNKLLEDTNQKVVQSIESIFAEASVNSEMYNVAKRIVEMHPNEETTAKLIRVFNSQVSTVDGKMIKVEVNRKTIPIVFNSEMHPLTT